eukprot:Nitzschia sp. Nitz4//scaffold339_size21316//7559//9244//NITZ4_008615-RA/size21316-processed-gene-0.21-mRNA-1//-1//CDS//3329548354//2772//frame0
MRFFVLVSTLMAATATSVHDSRRLSFEYIAGYQPATLVTDENAIDLDQYEMEVQLAIATESSYAIAQDIYENGGSSGSIAKVTLTSGLTTGQSKGTAVTGDAPALGLTADGILYEDYAAGATQIQIIYSVRTVQSNYVGCTVGALPIPVTDYCFAESGTLTIGDDSYTYSYDILTDNTNTRTLQDLSANAKSEMAGYDVFSKFYQYYGEYDYANQFVMAAFDGEETDFSNGNADFKSYGTDGKTEIIKKASAYLNAGMYVMKSMELAIEECNNGCSSDDCADDAAHAWDQAVAFYTGSKEGTDGESSGYFFHQLADKRCINFRTCGDLAEEIEGTSHVNIEIFRYFEDGKRNIEEGNCADLKSDKEKIEALMTIPLIQGTLRYAYIKDIEEDDSEKAEAEGAIFAAGILPLVHACDSSAASTIYDNMRTGGYSDFVEVKKAFESVYNCLNVECANVGGIFDTVSMSHHELAAPCGMHHGKDGIPPGGIVGIAAAGVGFLAIVVLVSMRCGGGRGHSGKEFDSGNTSSPPTVA